MKTARTYPVFLRLQGRRVVVVGDGAVARAKIPPLRQAGARVVRVQQRPFRASDLAGAWLVIAAGSPAENRKVARAAASRRVLAIVADEPELCSAFSGAVLRRRNVVIAVGTEGLSPALAALLRQGLEKLLPADLARWAALARRERTRWKQKSVPLASRRPLLLRALNELYATARRDDR